MILLRNPKVDSKDHWFLRMLTSDPPPTLPLHTLKKSQEIKKIRKIDFFAIGLFIVFNMLDARICSIYRCIRNIPWEMLALKKGSSFFPLTTEYIRPKPTLSSVPASKRNLTLLLNN